MLAVISYIGSMIGIPVKGEAFVTQAMVARVNPWLLVVIVAVVLLMAAVVLGVSSHALAWPWSHQLACTGSPGPCM